MIYFWIVRKYQEFAAIWQLDWILRKEAFKTFLRISQRHHDLFDKRKIHDKKCQTTTRNSRIRCSNSACDKIRWMNLEDQSNFSYLQWNRRWISTRYLNAHDWNQVKQFSNEAKWQEKRLMIIDRTKKKRWKSLWIFDK